LSIISSNLNNHYADDDEKEENKVKVKVSKWRRRKRKWKKPQICEGVVSLVVLGERECE
jgi:hypothetical protein